MAMSSCRHCGAHHAIDSNANPDWLCPHCERWQDSMACPTCGAQTRISTMAPENVPPAAESSEPDTKTEGD